MLEFICGIRSVGDKFSQKYFMIAVQEFFDERKNIFNRYIDFTF